jgi:hypothetical protein
MRDITDDDPLFGVEGPSDEPEPEILNCARCHRPKRGEGLYCDRCMEQMEPKP